MASRIDENRLINNGLMGMGLNNHRAILENDNSIDQETTNINITIIKGQFEFGIRNKRTILKTTLLIIEDDGIGMDEDNNNIQNLLTLYKQNKNNGNGKYGIGAIASDKNLSKNGYTMYFTKSKDTLSTQQIIIDWNNHSVWTNHVKVNNIDKVNEKFLERYGLIQNDRGTVNINTIDDNDIEKITKDLETIRFNYYDEIKSKNITIRFINKITNHNFTISHEIYPRFSDRNFNYKNIMNWEGSQYITFIINIFKKDNESQSQYHHSNTLYKAFYFLNIYYIYII